MKFACCLRVLMENKWDVLVKNDYPQNEYYIYIYIYMAKGGRGGVADDLIVD